MLSVRKIAARQLFARNIYNLGFGKERKPTPSDLDKYDVVVVGSGLGGVLATHLDAVVKDKYKIFVAYDNTQTYFSPERNLYEQGVYISLHSASLNLISVALLARHLPRQSLSQITLELKRSILKTMKLCFEMDE